MLYVLQGILHGGFIVTNPYELYCNLLMYNRKDHVIINSHMVLSRLVERKSQA